MISLRRLRLNWRAARGEYEAPQAAEHRHHYGRRPDAKPGDRKLRTLVEVLRDAGVPSVPHRGDIGHLANARNVAVHEGREMTDDELRPCLTTLTALLGKHEPASRRTLK